MSIPPNTPYFQAVSDNWKTYAMNFIEGNLLLDGKLCLYQNAHTPNPSDVLTDYVECDFTGYNRVLLNNWQNAFISSPGNVVGWHTEVGFEDLPGVNNYVYGAFVLDNLGQFVGAFQFAGGPFIMGTGVHSLSIEPGLVWSALQMIIVPPFP